MHSLHGNGAPGEKGKSARARCQPYEDTRENHMGDTESLEAHFGGIAENFHRVVVGDQGGEATAAGVAVASTG
eukprot:5957498-Alexandrium_andersonii.AAC.1